MDEMIKQVENLAIDLGFINTNRLFTAGMMNKIYEHIGSSHRVCAGDVVRKNDLEIIIAHIQAINDPTARQDQT